MDNECVTKHMNKITKLGTMKNYIENVISRFNHMDKILKSSSENILKTLDRL